MRVPGTRSARSRKRSKTLNVAVGYTHHSPDGERSETLYKNIYLEPAVGGPWGKSYSTVRDLYRFFEAMFEGVLIDGEDNWLADGWEIGGLALAGGGPGLNAMLLLQDGRMTLVLANQDPPGAVHVAEALQDAIGRASRGATGTPRKERKRAAAPRP